MRSLRLNPEIVTTYSYDAINQLLTVTDDAGNETRSVYDWGGRRIQAVHPASGETNLTYDPAGNLLTRQTANLQAEEKAVSYGYDYNRLIAISYPDHPENNVQYAYGNKNASFNRVGRLMLQEDATGAQEFFYDRLGNMEKVRRTVVIPNQAIATYVTQWSYDTWNRLTEMIYPDEEKVTYRYNTGGQLESVKGDKSYSYNYVTKIGYDKFEQRNYMQYCNGAETAYTYEPDRRRLSNLLVKAGSSNRRAILDNEYTYDRVDNVLSVTNSAPLSSTGMGGQMTHEYGYDGFYRLTSATGTYTGAGNKTASYNLDMSYDNLYNITSKTQHIEQRNVVFNGTLQAEYNLSYNLPSQKTASNRIPLGRQLPDGRRTGGKRLCH
jgi:YD repeat-containing protein